MSKSRKDDEKMEKEVTAVGETEKEVTVGEAEKEVRFKCAECDDNIFCAAWAVYYQTGYKTPSEDLEGKYNWVCPGDCPSNK